MILYSVVLSVDLTRRKPREIHKQKRIAVFVKRMGFVSSASVFSRVSVRLSGELYWSPYCFDSRTFSFVLPGEPWYNTDRFRPVRRNEGEEP